MSYIIYQKFIKNIGVVGFTNFLGALEKIITLPIITKLLGAENYGIWTQLGVTISLVTPFVLLGLNSAAIRFLPSQKNRRKEFQEGAYSALLLTFISALIIVLFFMIFSSAIAKFFQCQPVLVKILSLIILFECLILMLLSIFQALQEIKKYSFFMASKIFGEIGLVIGAVLLGYGLYGAVLSLLIIRVVIFLILLTIMLKKIGIKVPRFSPIKEYLRFGLPRLMGSISYWVVTSSDKYLIGFFLGVLFVGFYSPAYTLGNVINFFLYPLFFMLPVVLAESFDENRISEVKTYLKYSLKYFLMLAIPAVFGLSLLSKPLLEIISTKEIAQNAYYITPFVALSILVYGITSISNQILIVVKKTKIAAIVWMASAFLNFLLNLLFIPYWGIIGAAITTLLSYIFSLSLIFFYSFKELKFEIDWKFILKSISASAVMALFIFWFFPEGLLKTTTIIVTGAILYFGLLWLLKGVSRKEIDFLKGFLKKSN